MMDKHVIDICPWEKMETNRTYITDAFRKWTITQVCLDRSITVMNVTCLTNGTWSKDIKCPGMLH